MTRGGGASPRSSGSTAWLWLGPLLYMVVIGLYYVIRYSGRWAESDSASFAQLIRVYVQDGQILPDDGSAYPNGYLYQTIAAFLVNLTGLDIAVFQQLIFPLLASLIVLPAWLVYRELTESAIGATIATVLLLSQPEFLFVVLRSSHEKFTRILLLLCLFWLVRSMKFQHRPRQFALHVGLFYLSAFAFIASNNLLAHSFIAALAIALIVGVVLAWRKTVVEPGSMLLPRFFYATLICLGLVYLFTFYVYPPAQHDLIALQNLWQRIAALFLDVQATKTNAYTTIAIGWISLPAYFAVSLANWIILGFSLLIWLRQGYVWIVRKQSSPTHAQWLLWLLYVAFAAQGALSVVADATGALGGNLQHRLFPSFSLIAVGLVAATLVRWQPRRSTVVVRLCFAVAVSVITLLSVMKATNEPLLSNKWTFYRSEELAALRWTNEHLANAFLWTEFDERLEVAMRLVYGDSEKKNVSYGGTRIIPETRNMVLSDITRMRSRRLRAPIPVPLDALRVYDNGTAQLYHLRPLTPYQR